MRLSGWQIGKRGLFVVALFVPTAVLGGGAIIALRAYGFHVFYAVGAGCAMIVIYGALAVALKPRAMSTGPIGDNCYYLGFVYTLVSLAWTLYALSEETGEDPIVGIVSGFGIALLTTLTGLVARVALNPPRVDLADEEERSRVSLAREAYLLQKELIQTTAAHKQFGTIVRQSLQEFKETYAADLAVELSERRRAFIDQMNQHENAITEHLIGFGTRTTKVFDDAMRNQLRQRLTDFDDAAKKMTEAAESGANDLGDAAATFEETARSISKRADVISRSLSNGLVDVADAVDEAATSIESALERSEAATQRIEKRVEVLQRQLDALEGAAPRRRSIFGLTLGTRER